MDGFRALFSSPLGPFLWLILLKSFIFRLLVDTILVFMGANGWACTFRCYLFLFDCDSFVGVGPRVKAGVCADDVLFYLLGCWVDDGTYPNFFLISYILVLA